MKTTSILFFLFIFLVSCQKNQSLKVINPKPIAALSDSSRSVLPADSVRNSATPSRPIQLFANCLNSGVNTPFQSPSTYTIIGRFPATTVGNISTVLAKTSWVSPNGLYKVVNQPDGNLVLYKTNGEISLWGSSNTFGKNTRFQLQADMNMVAYVGNTGVWNTGTQDFYCENHPSPEKLPRNLLLAVANDGNLFIIADGTSNKTIVLAGTRTTGGVPSPNNGSFYKAATSSPTGISFVY